MNKTNDFASDLKTISDTVESDVGTIMKLVREKQSTQEVPPSQAVTPKQKVPDQNTTHELLSADDGFIPRNRSRPRPAVRSRPNPMIAEQVVLRNVTTRLRPETNERLSDAALRQRLKRVLPDTRQDIIEAALQDWLHRHGYGN